MKFEFLTYLPFRWLNVTEKNEKVQRFLYNMYIKQRMPLFLCCFVCYLLCLATYFIILAIGQSANNWLFLIFPLLVFVVLFIFSCIIEKKVIKTTHESINLEVKDGYLYVYEPVAYTTLLEREKGLVKRTEIKLSDILTFDKKFEENEVYGAVGVISYIVAKEIIYEKDEKNVISSTTRFGGDVIFSAGRDNTKNLDKIISLVRI